MRQRCDDPFDSLLGLDKLKAAPGLARPFTRLTGNVDIHRDLGHTKTAAMGLFHK